MAMYPTPLIAATADRRRAVRLCALKVEMATYLPAGILSSDMKLPSPSFESHRACLPWRSCTESNAGTTSFDGSNDLARRGPRRLRRFVRRCSPPGSD